jgi:hypothetical protein
MSAIAKANSLSLPLWTIFMIGCLIEHEQARDRREVFA